MSNKSRMYAGMVVRLLLGVIFLLSGIGKLIEPGSARYLVELMATEYYWLIEYATTIVLATSVLEIMLALLLFSRWWTRLVLLVSALMVAFFTLVLGYFWFQGQSIENCGCFGAFGIGGGLSASLIRNGILLVLIALGYLFSGQKGEVE